VRAKFSAQSAEPVGGTAEQYATYIQSETAKVDKVIREGKIKMEFIPHTA